MRHAGHSCLDRDTVHPQQESAPHLGWAVPWLDGHRRTWDRGTIPGRPARAGRRGGQPAGLDALLLTPGPDLRYVTGYDALQLERLTCLAIPAAGEPFLVVPRLEYRPGGVAAGSFGLEIIPSGETDDPYALVAGRLGAVARSGWPTGCGR